jgi:uncharacterized ion transporter superfamily protein YfcC
MTRSRFPHPLVLLVAGVLLASVATYLLPAGQYDRQVDPATGRDVVVAGTFQETEPAPVNLFESIAAITAGVINAADVIVLVFLIGGAFAVVDRAGTLTRLVEWLLHRLRHRDLLIIPVVGILFASAGALENMQEEIVPMLPVLLLLTGRLGFNRVTAVAMSAGAALVGSSFSPINPFQVGIAQRMAELPLLSGWAFRSVFLLLSVAFWLLMTTRYAMKTRSAPGGGDELPAGSDHDTAADPHVIASPAGSAAAGTLGPRHGTIVAMVIVTFVVLAYGLLGLGWGFPRMGALFFFMGVAAGLVGGLGLQGTAEGYVEGFRSMALPALLIGVARTIYVVLEQGRVVDTLVHGLLTPLEGLPTTLSALGMLVAHFGIHIPVSSVSGQAVLTMPVLVPLSDLLGLSRQVAVLAYQYGAGLCDAITPTNGSVMAILAAAGVGYNEWFKVTARWILALLALAAVAIVVAVGLGLQ